MLTGALAEGLDIDGLTRTARAQGFDAAGFMRRLLSGEALASLVPIEALPGMVKRQLLRGLSSLTLDLALPAFACVLLRMTTGGEGTGFMLNLLCALCCGKALTRTWLSARAEIAVLIDGLLHATEAMTPVLASAAALTGGSLWSAAMGPLSNLCATFMQRVIRDWGLKLCGGAAAVAVCCAVAGRYALNRLFELIKAAAGWLLGLAVFLYGGLISAQGLVSAAKDGAASRAAKAAMESLIPIISGGVSNAAGALAVSAGLAKSAVGVTGVALVARLCVGPMLRLGGKALALKLVSAAMEPMGEGAVSALIGRFGDILEILLAMSVCCGLMAGMLPAALAALSGGLLQ